MMQERQASVKCAVVNERKMLGKELASLKKQTADVKSAVSSKAGSGFCCLAPHFPPLRAPPERVRPCSSEGGTKAKCAKRNQIEESRRKWRQESDHPTPTTSERKESGHAAVTSLASMWARTGSKKHALSWLKNL